MEENKQTNNFYFVTPNVEQTPTVTGAASMVEAARAEESIIIDCVSIGFDRSLPCKRMLAI